MDKSSDQDCFGGVQNGLHESRISSYARIARIKATDRDQGLHQPVGRAASSGSPQLITSAVRLRRA